MEVGTHCPEKRRDFRDRLSVVQGCPRFSHGVGLIEAEASGLGMMGGKVNVPYSYFHSGH